MKASYVIKAKATFIEALLEESVVFAPGPESGHVDDFDRVRIVPADKFLDFVRKFEERLQIGNVFCNLRLIQID
jgi:hypothetical protein